MLLERKDIGSGQYVATFNSSNLSRALYNQVSGEMFITFIRKTREGGYRGDVYLVAGVEPELFEDFCAAPSQGTFFNTRIKGRHGVAVGGNAKFSLDHEECMGIITEQAELLRRL